MTSTMTSTIRWKTVYISGVRTAETSLQLYIFETTSHKEDLNA